jgi:glycosyltransferase involved in cell wall biosynthesis
MFENHGYMNTKLITNCMDVDAFTPAKFDPENKKVLFICAHGAQKWKGWNEWQKIKAELTEMNVGAEFVEKLGGIEYKDMPAVYQDVAVFVFCSMYNETTGMAALEAQSCGVPVVAYASGGLKDNVVNNFTGFVVERGNYKNAANCVKELLNSPSMRERMGKSAREHIVNNFNIDNMVDEHIALYESILSGEV